RPGVARQQLQEGLQNGRIEGQAGRSLPEDRTELFPQLQHTRTEEIGQRSLDVPQAPDVSDETGSFDRKYESIRSRLAPGAITCRPLQRIERAVDLDGVHLAGGERQLPILRQSLRKE